MFNNTPPSIAISSNESAVPKLNYRYLNEIIRGNAEDKPIVQGEKQFVLHPNYGMVVLTSGILIGTLITLSAFVLLKK